MLLSWPRAPGPRIVGMASTCASAPLPPFPHLSDVDSLEQSLERVRQLVESVHDRLLVADAAAAHQRSHLGQELGPAIVVVP